ncbi:hypothetical protein K525DRAFT_184177 [Schizophyllum commune Loenen D]|nr:hypothetical protein K525DRAFT_184177 [Schizophyllum commune Loenen D]
MLRRPEVRVYSYEASTRRCKDVALQESFIIGGILTATPMALVSDLASSTKRLKQAADHPLWSPYVLPFVLGMALTLYYDGQDPLKAYKSNPQAFVFRSLLEAIVDRRCHLVAPPATPLNAPLSLAFPHSVAHVIQIALHDFHSMFGGISNDLWEAKAKALLEQDINSWRTDVEHVRIRHACVLVKPRDSALSDSTHTQIEWLPPSGEFVRDGFLDEEETM